MKVFSFLDDNRKMSDERTKDSDKVTHISDCLNGISAYLFKYKDSYQKKYNDTGLTDDKVHLGVMAQELEANPLTESAVIENEDGIKTVDTRQVALVDLALITDLADRIHKLEKIIGA